ncbi:MAG: glutamate 5-kinase [Candidatus Omnitrophica bacterium]|nr:glutamate 5-kinase [Candidatus Omnitrophota bacterium]
MKKIVVKIGSSIIAPSGKLDARLVERLVSDIIVTEKSGHKIILVSSGAIACGAHKVGVSKKPHDAHSLMALASIGQIILMDAYSDAFRKYDRVCAQILLTWDDFDNRKRFLNARATIQKLLSMNIIPVINENDAVSSDEIKFGDNDRLSALVADLVGADTAIILSDVEGLMDKGKVVTCVPKVSSKIFSLVNAKQNAFTSGGMYTKLQAANTATNSGANVIIASGNQENIITRLASGVVIGTTFLAAKNVQKARKRWIAFSKKTKGKIYIDDGAKEAILHKGRSLLGVGIIKIEGEFKKKDAVEVRDKEGTIIGCGLVNYTCEELRNGQGKKFEKEIIHRDNFAKKDECQ